jgi:hypothetical protein
LPVTLGRVNAKVILLVKGRELALNDLKDLGNPGER